MTQDTVPLIDMTEMVNENKRLSEENETLKSLLTFADVRINKMVKERSHDTRGHISNASR